MGAIKKKVALSGSWSYGCLLKLKITVIMSYEPPFAIKAGFFRETDYISFCRKFYAEKESYRKKLSKLYQKKLWAVKRYSWQIFNIFLDIIEYLLESHNTANKFTKGAFLTDKTANIFNTITKTRNPSDFQQLSKDLI